MAARTPLGRIIVASPRAASLIQLGPIGAFVASFMAAWDALDYLDPEGAEDVASALDEIADDFAKWWYGGEPSSPVVILPAFNEFNLAASCGLNHSTWFIGPVYATTTQTLCTQTGNWPNTLNAQVKPGQIVVSFLRHWSRGGTTDSPDQRWDRKFVGARFSRARAVPVARPIGDVFPEPYAPAYPASSPWSLPVQGPGVNMAPAPYPWSVPRPAARPATRTGSIQLPVPWPLGLPRVALRPALSPQGVNPLPPGPGKKEMKLNRAGGRLLYAAASMLTETKDFVGALHKALPFNLKSKCQDNCSLLTMMKDLYKAANYIESNETYVKDAVTQLLKEGLEDTFYGMAGSQFRQAADALRPYGGPESLQKGDRYRPYYRSDKVNVFEETARYIVDAVW